MHIGCPPTTQQVDENRSVMAQQHAQKWHCSSMAGRLCGRRIVSTIVVVEIRGHVRTWRKGVPSLPMLSARATPSIQATIFWERHTFWTSHVTRRCRPPWTFKKRRTRLCAYTTTQMRSSTGCPARPSSCGTSRAATRTILCAAPLSCSCFFSRYGTC